MGSFHGAELCELVGLYLMTKIEPLLSKENFGIYRDDGLAVIPNLPDVEMERLKKTFMPFSNKKGLLLQSKSA